jgi:hypothetical protein
MVTDTITILVTVKETVTVTTVMIDSKLTILRHHQTSSICHRRVQSADRRLARLQPQREASARISSSLLRNVRRVVDEVFVI